MDKRSYDLKRKNLSVFFQSMEYLILFFILNAFQGALANDLILVELGSVLCFAIASTAFRVMLC